MLRSRLSISAKLPLGVAVLLAVCLSATAMAAYVEVRASAIALATERLGHAERQIVDLIAASWPKNITTFKTEANTPDVIATLTKDDAAARARLVARWSASKSGGSIELWDAQLKTVITTGASFAPLPDSERQRLANRASTEGIVFGRFAVVDQKALETVVAAAYADGQPVGYLVDRRSLNTSAQFMTLVTSLIGPNARLLLGNATGDVWTDFSNPVTGPGLDVLLTPGIMRYQRADRHAVMALQQNVPQTPWVVVAEMPEAVVMAPVQRFVRRAAGIVVVLALIGAGVGWWFSRRFTEPLRWMTDAAVSIAGAHTSAPPLTTRDELEQLAFAFDQMVGAVKSSDQALRATNAQLEGRVAARTAELTEANRELEAFSYSVSHDLRAPLRAMSGFAQILVEDHATELSPPARKCVDTICNNAKSMGQLIDDLLEFSKLSRQPIKRVPVDMAALARSAIRDATAPEAGRSIDCVIEDMPPAQAEPSLVALVIDNLVRNAVKFTRRRTDARIEVGATSSSNGPAYFVRDNGVGFDMQYADKLFGVFQRLHRKDEFEGTGVGLAIVQRVIVRHGGQVWAEAEVGRGATFFFTLPAQSNRTT